jgi:hypothetical protein
MNDETLAPVRLPKSFGFKWCQSMLILLGILVPSAASADSLKDWLDKPPQETFETDKPALQIEHCVGVGISDWLTVGSFRGVGKVEIYGSPTANFSNVIYLAVTVEDLGQNRKVSLRAHKAWDDRTAALIRVCI